MCYTCGCADYVLPDDIPEMIAEGRRSVFDKIYKKEAKEWIPDEQKIALFKKLIEVTRCRCIHYWVYEDHVAGDEESDALNMAKPPELRAKDIPSDQRRFLFSLTVQMDAGIFFLQHHLKVLGYSDEQLKQNVGTDNYDFVLNGHPDHPGNSLTEELNHFLRREMPDVFTAQEKATANLFKTAARHFRTMMEFEAVASVPERRMVAPPALALCHA